MDENKIEPNLKIIKNAALDDVRPGDHITWEYAGAWGGVTTFERREGVAHHRDHDGDWCTEEGRYVTDREVDGRTITIRRTVKELPTDPGVVIVTNDGNDNIEATTGGPIWHANEAVLGGDGRWHGVWRRAGGRTAISSVLPWGVTPSTWKVG